MLKRVIAFALALTALFTLCSCEMRGNRVVLNAYSPELVYKAYFQYAKGERDIQFPLGEEKPSLRACVMNKIGVYASTLDIYIINESRYDIYIHGYAYATTSLEKDNTCQAIYYHPQKHVSNSTYEIHIDTQHNAYLSYEVLTDNHLIAAKEDLMAFIFFKYEDTEYVGGMNKDGNFIYWPLMDTMLSPDETTRKATTQPVTEESTEEPGEVTSETVTEEETTVLPSVTVPETTTKKPNNAYAKRTEL